MKLNEAQAEGGTEDGLDLLKKLKAQPEKISTGALKTAHTSFFILYLTQWSRMDGLGAGRLDESVPQ